jgi:hypothetical protein
MFVKKQKKIKASVFCFSKFYVFVSFFPFLQRNKIMILEYNKTQNNSLYMAIYKELVSAFLSKKAIAVTGASRSGTGTGNIIFKKLKDAGYNVYQVNPEADEIKSDKCYRSLINLPEKAESVIICTKPEDSIRVIQECAATGVQYAWIHRAFGKGSYSDEAAGLCNQLGIRLIPSGCPMMFIEPVDFPHKCFHWIFRLTGKIPKTTV